VPQGLWKEIAVARHGRFVDGSSALTQSIGFAHGQGLQAGHNTPGGAVSHTILITVNFFDNAAAALLANCDCRVVQANLPQGVRDGDLSQAQLLELLENADAWIVGTASVTRKLLEDRPKVRIIARRGVGYDRVDLVAARELGRVVTICPGANEAAVADHAVMLMLAVGRRVCELNASMRAGNWTAQIGKGLHRSTVGIVGFGGIGKAVAGRLAGFDAEILAYDERVDVEYAKRHNVRFASLDELLGLSDFVTVHLPLTSDTRHIIGANAIERMKAGAILINTARGGLVDERALLRALESGHLGGAGIDVFEVEDDESFRETARQLCMKTNVVATPHVAGFTGNSLERANLLAAEAVLAVLAGGSPSRNCVVADGRS
jgi:D-3-phosphoglycerate dehydrogenase